MGSSTAQSSGEQQKQQLKPPAVNWKHWAVYGIALLALLWVFHDVHPRKLLAVMVIKNWWYVVLAVSVDILTYIFQGFRWSLLLSPLGRLHPARSTQAIYGGLFTSEVFPLRAGEVVRAYLASRWLGVPGTSVIPSMLVERLLDGVWLAIGIAYAASVVPLPSRLADAGRVLGVIVLIGLAAFAWVVLRREREIEHAVAEPEKPNSFLRKLVSRFAVGLRQIGISKNLFLAAICSACMLACQALAAWLMMLALGIHLPLSAATTVMLIVRLGTSIPNAPANVGSFQFFTVLSMGLFGVDKTVAAGYSLVDFFVLTAPLWILGLLAISRAGITLRGVRAEVMARTADR